jgi:hypothetical protein
MEAPMAVRTSSQWSKTEVLKQLRAKGRGGRTVAAQVFLKDDVEDVPAEVETIVSKAGDGSAKRGLKVGKIHPLAKSFSLEANPEAFAAIADQPSVKSILPNEVDDVYPKPVKVKRL